MEAGHGEPRTTSACRGGGTAWPLSTASNSCWAATSSSPHRDLVLTIENLIQANRAIRDPPPGREVRMRVLRAGAVVELNFESARASRYPKLPT